MRFYSPASASPQWFLTLFFRETGQPNPVRVGKSVLSYGKGREAFGRLAYCQMEVKNEHASIELFPGARLLAAVCSPTPGLDQSFVSSLSPQDEVELVKPEEIVVVQDM